MLRVWNVTLVILTFFLTIFGTFMTRSGVVQSVHAFGEDKELAWMFTVFMIAILSVSFGLVMYRLPLLRARNELDSWASREAAFLVNNWILLFSAFFILFATMFPTLSEALTGERLTVGPPFFNRWMMPIGLILLFLTGVGPLLAWRKSTTANLLNQFLWPTTAAVVTMGALWAIGLRVWTSGICFGLCAFVTGTIVQEFWRGTVVRKNSTKSDVLTALIGLVARSRRRYGGYIVHVGMVLIFLGFAGEGYKQEEQVLLKAGQQVEVGRYMVRNDAIRISDDGRKQMVTSYMTVMEDGKEIGKLYPARWFFRKHESEPTTEVAIRRSITEDLYIVLAAYTVEDQTGQFQVVVNPLVNWIWLGFGVLALGTGIALLPERAFNYALARLPPEASIPAAAAPLILLLLLVPTTSAFAQEAGLLPHEQLEQTVLLVPKTELEKDLHRSIICMCGTCGRKNLAECTCSEAARMRAEIAGLVSQGKSRDEIVQYHIDKYGSQEPLAAPLDRGFNRLAWLLPYALGAGGLVVAALAAVRWSRHAAAASRRGDEATESSPELEARLDDELSQLD
jgi:cytochrome c-type biogenesis protein CcmF